MNPRPETLLYFYPAPATFVTKDLQILESEYNVKRFHFSQASPMQTILGFFRQFAFLIRYAGVKKIVVQFGGYHSFLPALFGKFPSKRTFLVLGGTECSCFPEFNYGNYRKKGLGYFTRKSIEWAGVVIPVHKAMIDYPYTYFVAEYPRQGFKNFVGKLNGRVEVAEYGFEPQREGPAPERELGFVTIAGFSRENIYALKGLDLICKIAPAFPQLPFIIIGAKGRFVNYPVPANVKILPFISEEEKYALLHKYTFYFQLSITEGFPNALCEAMVSGMIPIVSDVCSMPDIIGTAGYVLKHRDEKELQTLVTSLLHQNLEAGARKSAGRILSTYTPQRRKERLLGILRESE